MAEGSFEGASFGLASEETHRRVRGEHRAGARKIRMERSVLVGRGRRVSSRRDDGADMGRSVLRPYRIVMIAAGGSISSSA